MVYIVLQCNAGKFDTATAAVAALSTAAATAGDHCRSASYVTGLLVDFFTFLLGHFIFCLN